MRFICFGTIEPRLRGALRAAADEAGTKCDLVIKNGEAEWRPAIDLNRTILVGQLVAIVALLVARSVVKTLARARR